LRLFHRQSIISFTDYQKILNIYQFFPKNKYVEELNDTENIFVVETEGVIMVECEIFRKKFKKIVFNTHLNACRKKMLHKICNTLYTLIDQ
jgi:hypothetical protein